MTPERSLTDVLQDILQHLQEIVRAEFRLAKVEVKNDASDMVRSAVWLVAAGVVALLAVILALWAGVFALAQVMALWAATLVVGGVLALVAGVLFVVGRSKAKQLRPLPERTIATVQENIEWIKRPRK
jgi:uncharacterized membrane protein YqjE